MKVKIGTILVIAVLMGLCIIPAADAGIEWAQFEKDLEKAARPTERSSRFRKVLTAEEAIDLIEMSLSIHPENASSSQIRKFIAQTKDPYGLDAMSFADLKTAIAGLEVIVFSVKDIAVLDEWGEIYRLFLREAVQRARVKFTPSTNGIGSTD